MDKEERRHYNKKYYETHREQKMKYQKKYRETHREQIKAYKREYDLKKNNEKLVNKIREIEELENELKYVEDNLFINDYLSNLKRVQV